jgi:addiction module HigA family antidote
MLFVFYIIMIESFRSGGTEDIFDGINPQGVRENMIRIPTNRTPTHPGEMLLEEFLNPMGITQRQLADAIHVPYQRVNNIVNGRRGITPSTALRLAKYFNTSSDFWMNIQLRWEMYYAQQEESGELKTIHPLAASVR